MVVRIWYVLFLAAALPAAAVARPADRHTPPAPAVAQPARPATPAPTSAPAATNRELDRRAIYDILRGGAMLQDVGVEQHLWNVAGSLAAQSWTPPVVTVRMVVAAAGAEKSAK